MNEGIKKKNFNIYSNSSMINLQQLIKEIEVFNWEI